MLNWVGAPPRPVILKESRADSSVVLTCAASARRSKSSGDAPAPRGCDEPNADSKATHSRSEGQSSQRLSLVEHQSKMQGRDASFLIGMPKDFEQIVSISSQLELIPI